MAASQKAVKSKRTAATTGTDALGTGIRARRKHLGLTLNELAERTQLSQPFLSQVERGQAQPSMRSLNVIANALGTSGPALLAGPLSSARGLVQHSDVGGIDNDEGAGAGPVGGLARSLATGVDSLVITEFAGGMPVMPDYYHHEGHEILYVVSGQIRFELDGSEPVILGARDSIAYDGSHRHRWHMLDDEPAVVLMITSV